MKWQGKVYQWHKRISLLVFIPLAFWAFSGLMHPFMSNWFRPSIDTRTPPVLDVKQSDIQISLQQTLNNHGIKTIDNARFIEFDQQLYYQVTVTEDSAVYINTQSGVIESGIDKKYAVALARHFLNDHEAKVLSMEKVYDYSWHYKKINRLLPVWKVSFDRPDGMNVYVETLSSKLGTFNNSWRRAYISIFNSLHNWDFIPGPEWIRIILVSLFSLLILLGGIAGIISYGVLWKARRKVPKTGKSPRSSHRKWGITFSVVLLLFSFSGLYHVLVKFQRDDRQYIYDNSRIAADELNQLEHALFNFGSIQNFSLARISGETFCRVKSGEKHDYLSLVDIHTLENGDTHYAKELASRFSGVDTKKIIRVEPIFGFKGEYGFVNKRLPVIKIVFDTPDHLSYYIETSTGKLAAKVVDSDRREGFSFAFLHKYHFLDGLGKNVRDSIVVLLAISLLILVYKGIVILRK